MTTPITRRYSVDVRAFLRVEVDTEDPAYIEDEDGNEIKEF